LVIREGGGKGGETLGSLVLEPLFEGVLVNEDEIVLLTVLFGGGGVGAPLFEAAHFLGEVELGAAPCC